MEGTASFAANGMPGGVMAGLAGAESRRERDRVERWF